jgi:hypothetical protein
MEKSIKNKSSFFYAMSLAASWAWGTSLVVGMQTIQEKGIIPFLIWAIANSLALPLFGFIAYRIPNLSKVVNSKIVTFFTTIVMVFCLWIQMNAIYQYLNNLNFITDIASKIISIAIMIFMVIALYKDGLVKSIFIDNPLWFLCYALLFVLLILGFVFQVERYSLVSVVNQKEISWALNSCIILFSGPIMCIQNWQMAEKLKAENKMKAHYTAGLLFALYMAFVGCLGYFHFNGIMNIILVLVVLCVSLSTADAAIVGLQKIAGKKIGVIIALIAIALWNFVSSMGVMGLWTTMGNMRKYVAGACIIVAIGIYFYQKRKNREKVIKEG